MLGNLFRESGVVNRLSDTAQNALNNIVVIFLGVTVGATAKGSTFLDFIPRLINGDLVDGSVVITILKSPVGILTCKSCGKSWESTSKIINDLQFSNAKIIGQNSESCPFCGSRL